jgi:hypothetical protein
MKETKETGGQEAPDQAKIDQLKATYPEGIYSAELNFNDEESNPHRIEFIFRKPSQADVEAFQKAAVKNAIVANINFIQSLIVHPEPRPVVNELREYPMAASRFVDEELGPFLGAHTVTSRKKL